MKVFLFLFVCVYLNNYADGELAPFITPCRASDSACLKSSAQRALPILAAGVPSLGISTLDPMHVDRILATQAGLEMDFKNTVVKGLKDCNVESLSRKGKKTFLDLRCSVVMTGDYKLNGKLLILSIKGDGRFKIKIRDIIVKLVYEVSDRIVNGVKYWDLRSWEHSSDVKTGVHFNFQNLFNGNKELADTVQKFANDNWKGIFQEVAPPIVDAIVSNIIAEIKKLFDKVPENQLALP